MMKKLQILKVNYGLASRYDNVIEINVKLKGKLRQHILEHEVRHNKGKYTYKDFKNDFQSKNPYFFQSLKFALSNPEALIGWFPTMYSYALKTWSFNTSSIFPLILYSLIFALSSLALFNVNIIQGLLAFFNIIVFMNVLLLIYTHIYVKFAKVCYKWRRIHRI